MLRIREVDDQGGQHQIVGKEGQGKEEEFNVDIISYNVLLINTIIFHNYTFEMI